MNPTVKQDLLSILKNAQHILKSGNATQLKELSNHTIHNASVFQDEDSISIAVVIYSLSKIMERDGINITKVITLLNTAEKKLAEDKLEQYRSSLKKVVEYISEIDSKLKLYIQQVIEQAQIKKGSKLYYHGISIAQAASLLGITQWELMNYIGKTRITDAYAPQTDIKKRLEFVRGIFGK